MKNSNNLTGQLAKLPGGEQVKIEIVYSDGYASVRRTAGERKGARAVCAIAKLELAKQSVTLTNQL